MQEAFLRALEQLDQARREPQLDLRTLKVLHAAAPDDPTERPRGAADALHAKLVYSARRLAGRWCSYTRGCSEAPGLLDALRDLWVVFARQLGSLTPRQRALVLWEMASATRPESVKHDGERLRYLTRRASTDPDLFVGLTSCSQIPWPGPAAFFVHAIEELEGASADERAGLHCLITEQWNGEPGWLMFVLAGWVLERHQGARS
jgi:hypothetical protein